MQIIECLIKETFNVGDSIRITVLGVRGEQVQLGIQAPGETPIYRQELFEQISRTKSRNFHGDNNGSSD